MIHASYNRTMRLDVCVGCPRVACGQNVEQGGVHLFVNSGTRNPKATIAPLFYNLKQTQRCTNTSLAKDFDGFINRLLCTS